MKHLFTSSEQMAHVSILIIRATLGLVLIPHGAQLLLGWFGGFGFSASMNYFTQTEALPWVVSFLVILLQSFGAIFILAGLFTRITTLGISGLFVGMVVKSHWEYGFFMNWMGNQKGEGFEFHLLVLGLCLSLLFFGAGKYSVDAFLAKKFQRIQQPAFKVSDAVHA